jgi:hypothetical protein
VTKIAANVLCVVRNKKSELRLWSYTFGFVGFLGFFYLFKLSSEDRHQELLAAVKEAHFFFAFFTPLN